MTVLDELRSELGRMASFRDLREAREAIDITEIRPAEAPLDLVAVDGSYTFLWNLGSMWLAVARAAAIPYVCTGTSFHKRAPEIVDRAIMVSTWEEVVDRQGEFYRRLFDATRGSGDQHREMVNEFRKHLEGELALRMAERMKGVIIALDGSLAAVPKELDHLEDVVAACEANDNVLVGVSKDSLLHAFGQSLPDEQFLRGYGKAGYVRVPKDFEGRQRGLLYGDVYFARLHPQAGKWFRVDVATPKDDPDFVFAHLAAHARSGISPGYPFPLIEAHRLAVFLRQFPDRLVDEILKECTRLGIPAGDVMAGLTATEGRRQGAFHVYLDQIARDVK